MSCHIKHRQYVCNCSIFFIMKSVYWNDTVANCFEIPSKWYALSRWECIECVKIESRVKTIVNFRTDCDFNILLKERGFFYASFISSVQKTFRVWPTTKYLINRVNQNIIGLSFDKNNVTYFHTSWQVCSRNVSYMMMTWYLFLK